ncbi:MAG: transporter [Bacteroidota bacterium]|nr:transporter [Bacteroidota bacterium]
MKYITRTVWVLSFISLFTDIASEMLYPVMPIYLKSIGFSIVLIGILEGVAEAIAGLSKGYFGKLSDNSGKRVPYIRLGYGLSALSKPMMAVFVFPIWIFIARTIDRFGKGIRTGARDALLSDEATTETKGKVFGFHRGMDTLGAVIGPVSALIYLQFYPHDYRNLFLLAFIPGLFSIMISFLIKEKNKQRSSFAGSVPTPVFSFLGYWKTSPLLYKKIVVGLLLFTLFNSSDVFLLLRIKQSGASDTMVIGVYIFYNIVYALFSFPLGALADKIGLKKIFTSGLIIFALVYAGMSVNNNLFIYFSLFFLYGMYAAATEGISKAWISNITNKKDTATAIGFFTGFQSICTMLASSIAGLIWYRFGAGATFMTTTIATILVAVYFIFYTTLREKNPNEIK